jgi:hypothetical protein
LEGLTLTEDSLLDTAVHSQFVNYTDIVSRYPAQRVEAAFALAALMEIPEQYKVIMNEGNSNR